MRTRLESARISGSTFGVSATAILMTARSEDGSTPRTWASTLRALGPKRTATAFERPTTCAFVTIVPSRAKRKPVPVAPRVRTETTAGLARA
jgi:hypothetical protein